MSDQPSPDLSALSDALLRLADSLERLAHVAAQAKTAAEEKHLADADADPDSPPHTWWSRN